MQFGQLGRREFITLLSSAATAWPAAARAQQPAMPVIGFLSTRSPEESAKLVAVFNAGLKETGYVEGQNVIVEYRWARGDYSKLAGMAKELVTSRVNVLVAVADPATLAARDASSDIPIVATFAADAVESGFVRNLARPDGNITGVSALAATLEPKRLGLLHELLSSAKTIGVLLNPTFAPAVRQLKDIQDAAHTMGIEIDVVRASTDSDIDTAFQTLVNHRTPVLIVAADRFSSHAAPSWRIWARRLSSQPSIAFANMPWRVD